jgi:hypothetical protein
VLDALRSRDEGGVHHFTLEILLYDFLAFFDDSHHARAFLPAGLSPIASKISLRRSTWLRVCSSCSSNPERSFSDVAAFGSPRRTGPSVPLIRHLSNALRGSSSSTCSNPSVFQRRTQNVLPFFIVTVVTIEDVKQTGTTLAGS